jgi:formylglycine-generating enzyme required for sulfatase activity
MVILGGKGTEPKNHSTATVQVAQVNSVIIIVTATSVPDAATETRQPGATLAPGITESLYPTEPPTHTPQIDTPTPTPTTPPVISAANPKDGAQLVLIPSGKFLMGADQGSPYFFGAESPSHEVTLDTFRIYITEVTNAMYRACVDAQICPRPEPTPSDSIAPSQYFTAPAYNNYPVVLVTNADAATYCQWAGGRLPTEAEWEKAARGTDGRLFPWGNNELTSSLANFCDNGCPGDEVAPLVDGYRFTAPVGSFPAGASPYGVLDMGGNVLEWASDWYVANYYNSPTNNPTGAASGTRHPIRGGSWDSGRGGLRPAARASLSVGTVMDTVGFRCAMDAP